MTAHESSAQDYESQLEAPKLSEPDTAWLKLLAGSDVDQAWFDEANARIEVGSKDMRNATGSSSEIVKARYKFFGELLGWSDPDHTLHGSYKRLQEHSLSLIPIKTVIATQRLLHDRNIANDRVIIGNASVLWKRHGSVVQRLDKLEELGYDVTHVVEVCPPALNPHPASLEMVHDLIEEYGKDPLRVLTGQPTLFGHSITYLRNLMEGGLKSPRRMDSDTAQWLADYCLGTLGLTPKQFQAGIKNLWRGPSLVEIKDTLDVFAEEGLHAEILLKSNLRFLNFTAPLLRRRVANIRRVCSLLDWQGKPEDLINSDQRILASSDTKMAVHARLFARYGRASMSKSEVGKLIHAPLESHIIALALGKHYTACEVKAVNSAFSKEARAELIEQLFQDREALKAQLGRGVVRAYEKYAERV